MERVTPGGIVIRNGDGPKPHISGVLVGVIANELARFTDFYTSLITVMGSLPPGSGLSLAKSVDVPGNCNALCRHMMAGTYSHLWLMGDDHVMEADIVTRLMAHDVDIVVPHCLKRYPPWPPVTYSHQNEDDHYVTAKMPDEGLTPIHASGSAGMLISRRVLEAIPDPWFAPGPGAAGLNEDLDFCRKAREAGFELYCDPTVKLGHIAIHTVWPELTDDGWHVSLQVGEENIPVRRIVADPVPT